MAREVRLTFSLLEDVTPDIFASKVALACGARYALRPGEAIRLPSDPTKAYVITDQPHEPLFGKDPR